MRSQVLTLLCLGVLTVGCDTSTDKNKTPSPAPAYVPPAGETTPAGDMTAAGDGSASADVERTKAVAGVGKQGQGYEEGIVTTPIKAYFTTRQAVELEVKLPHAMNLFKAENGRFPKSQEEFDSRIIEANAIALPELPPGHRYVYEPSTGELLVEHPK